MAGTVAAALRKAMLDQGTAGDFTSGRGDTQHGIGRPAILEKIGTARCLPYLALQQDR